MLKNRTIPFLLINYSLKLVISIVLIFVAGCYTSTRLKSYKGPSFQDISVRSVAILPIYGIQLPPNESREFTQSISQKFQNENPKLIILEPREAMDLITKKGLVEKYNELIRNYIATGNPSVAILKDIGMVLNVDAILQGVVSDVRQSEASFIQYAGTHLTLSYGLLSTSDGRIIWEVTSRARKTAPWSWSAAPPPYEVIAIALEEILTALPILK